MANQQCQTRLPVDLKKASPADQVGWLLAKSKLSGVGFDRAWGSAWEHIMWPHDTEHRREWRQVLGEGRDVWERAYLDFEVGPESLASRAAALASWAQSVERSRSCRR